MEEEVEYIDLYRLQIAVKQGMAQLFPQAVWVKAEIASIGRRSNGHCYLELSQSEDSRIVAQVRAVIWKNTYPFVSQYFRKVTGQELAAGQEVLVHVKVGYHEVYGLSLTIDDINPEFTLGAREALRKQTIERLETEGLMELQKELCLTELPYFLAVISAPDAAGYGDFRRHLLENPAGYAYQVDLFEALMQGGGAPQSICEALAQIEESQVAYDAVLILRGGGSDLDLACFDDYALAAAIARFPVPVFTAIGHDRDFHVADMVANRFVKTPTALADLFLECTAAEDERISALESRLTAALSLRVANLESELSSVEKGLEVSVARRLDGFAIALDGFEAGISGKVIRRLDSAESAVARLAEAILRGSAARLSKAEERVAALGSIITLGLSSRLSHTEDRLARIEESLLRGSKSRITQAEDQLVRLAEGLLRGSKSRLARAEDRLQQKAEYIRKMALNTVERAEIKLTSLDMQISAADPRKVLERGVPVVENRSGRKDTVAADYRPGDPLKVFLRDGKLDCVVQRVTLSAPADQSSALTA